MWGERLRGPALWPHPPRRVTDLVLLEWRPGFAPPVTKRLLPSLPLKQVKQKFQSMDVSLEEEICGGDD